MYQNQTVRMPSSLCQTISTNAKSRFLTLLPYFTALFLSIFVALYGEMYFEAYRAYTTGEYAGLTTGVASFGVLARVATIFIVCFIIGYAIIRTSNKILPYFYRYRYFIALAIALFFIFFELSGSSIGCWTAYIEGADRSGSIFGFPRSIRSDEWLVSVSTLFSQAFNGYDQTSFIIRGTSTDTTLISGLPSWSPATLFRPFLWGYLILGSAKGLAFAWILGKLALFFVSFECAMLYAKKNKALSCAAACLLTFSPMIVWWDTGATLIYGQGLVLALHFFLKAGTAPKKILSSILIAWLAGCFFLILYPAWMVPFFYIFALMGIWIILQYRKEVKAGSTASTFCPKRDIPLLTLCCFISALLLASVFFNAKDALAATSGTVYPGARISTGGGDISSLFNYGVSLFFATFDPQLAFNASESAVMFTLFPIGLTIGLIQAYRTKDSLLIILASTEIVFLLFYIIGFPEWLAKITLLSYTPPARLLFPLGFLDIAVLMRALATRENAVKKSSQERSWKIPTILSLCVAVALSTLCLIWGVNIIGITERILIIATIAVLTTLIIFAFYTQKPSFVACLSASLIVVVTITGCCVSPIQQGTAPLTNNHLYRSINNLAIGNNGLWIAEDTVTMGDFCISAGAPTINSTNAYPYLERWEQLDPTHENENIYNRFAHIIIRLQATQPTTFKLLQEDTFQVELNWSDLHTLGVKYLLTSNHYDISPAEGIRLTEAVNSNGYYIYEISYDGV